MSFEKCNLPAVPRQEFRGFDRVARLAPTREIGMKKSLVAVLMAGSISLGACATNDAYADDTLRDAGTGAAIEPIATDSTSGVGCSPAASKTIRLGR